MKKVLIIYGSYGNGHKSIAEYTASYINETNNKYEILKIDLLDYFTLFGKMCYKVFDLNAKMNASILRTVFYEFLDHRVTTLSYYELVEKSFVKELKNKIQNFNPDVVISTHYFASTIVGKLKKDNLINSKLITIITDYVSHEMWRKNYKYEDAIVVGNDLMQRELIKKGIPENKIKVFGIPLSSKFLTNDFKKTEILKKYNLIGNKLIFLFFAGGGTGYSSSIESFKRIVNKNFNIDLIFVCGKNQKLKNRCDRYIKKKNAKNVIVLGFTHDVANLLKISDVVITKPGGAILTETIALSKPLVLIPGLGGNEKGNAKYITRNGYGINCHSILGLTRKVKKICDNPMIIYKMKKRYLKNERKDSMQEIYNLMTKLIKK